MPCGWSGCDNGRFALQVHIADVSHYVRPGSPIDREALLRGTSVYFPDRAVPMLPVELSTDQCSLRPHEDRLVLSALLEIDATRRCGLAGVLPGRDSQRGAHDLYRGARRSRRRCGIARTLCEAHVERFELMQELALILNRKRRGRGSIDFDLPEPLLEFDEFGEMTGVTRAPRNIAHRLIEEFMLAANEAVASHLEAAGVPLIFRIHERPDPQARPGIRGDRGAFRLFAGRGRRAGEAIQRQGIAETRAVEAEAGGTVVPVDNPNLTSRSYQKLVKKIEGKPEERISSYLMLRSLKQARYSDAQRGALRAGRAQLHAFHFADPPLSRI